MLAGQRGKKPSPFFQIAAWAPLVFVLLKYFLLSLAASGVDFVAYYGAARSFLQGQNPYQHQEHLSGPMVYPMFTVLLCAPLSLLPEKTADILWDLLQVSLTVGSVLLLIAYYRPQARESSRGPDSGSRPEPAPRIPDHDVIIHWPLIPPLLMATFTPAYMDLNAGNIQPLNLFLVTLLGAALLHDRQGLAGMALAALCGIKVLPVVLVPALLIAGKRRAVAVWAAALAAYGLLLLATGWWRWELDLFTRLLPQFSAIGLEFRGLLSSLALLAGEFLYAPILDSRATFALAIRVAAVLVCSLYVLALCLGRARYRLAWQDGFSLGLMTLLLSCPVIIFPHFSWLFPAYVWLFTGYFKGRHGHVFFAMSLFLWIVIFSGRVLQDLVPSPLFPFRDAALAALLVLWVMNLARGVYLAGPGPMRVQAGFGERAGDAM